MILLYAVKTDTGERVKYLKNAGWVSSLRRGWLARYESVETYWLIASEQKERRGRFTSNKK